MTRAEYKALVSALNDAHRFGNSTTHAAAYAMSRLRDARRQVLEMGRPQ